MEVDKIDKIIEKLDSIEQLYGFGGVALILMLGFGGFMLWRFIIKRTEKIAEEISEKNLKTFQTKLDKGLVKFSSKHQKQIDAVQDCYQLFQELNSFINIVANGEKFTAQMKPNEEVEYLSKYRIEFKRSYKRNKILFPEKLNKKIESLFPEVDTFIQDYIDGLLSTQKEDDIPDEYRSEVQLAGIWPMGKLESTLEKMDEIGKEIENEFRKIYGVEE